MICAACSKTFNKKAEEGINGRARKYCSVKCRTDNQNRIHKLRRVDKNKHPSSREVDNIVHGYSKDVVTVNYDWVFSNNVLDWYSSKDSRFRNNYKIKKSNEREREKERQQTIQSQIV
jgi:hypothetical protein|tara:strand:- start:185 stop:538 length:354 start_codon:yes stop_codon:yes gene_type:complete